MISWRERRRRANGRLGIFRAARNEESAVPPPKRPGHGFESRLIARMIHVALAEGYDPLGTTRLMEPRRAAVFQTFRARSPACK
jgi:hypothetical protein